MKLNVILSLFLLLTACSTVSEKNTTSAGELTLNKLTSDARSNKRLGRLKAELRSKSGALLLSENASLGSCSDCVRGFSVNDFVGIKLVGNKNNLKAIRKQSSGVKIVDCPQGSNFSDEYSCSFKVKGQLYFLKLTLKS